MGLRSKLLLDS